MGALGGRGGSLASTRVLQERKKVKHFMRACVFWGNGLGEILGRFQRGSGRALGGIGWGGLAWGGWADPAGLAGSAAISGVSTCSQVTSDLQWLWNAFLLCLWFRCGLVSGFDLYLGSENQLPVPTQLWSQCPAAPLKKAAMTGLLGASGWLGWLGSVGRVGCVGCVQGGVWGVGRGAWFARGCVRWVGEMEFFQAHFLCRKAKKVKHFMRAFVAWGRATADF